MRSAVRGRLAGHRTVRRVPSGCRACRPLASATRPASGVSLPPWRRWSRCSRAPRSRSRCSPRSARWGGGVAAGRGRRVPGRHRAAVAGAAGGPRRGHAGRLRAGDRQHERLLLPGLERVPLGVAVALEMVGPIAVAIAGSRRAARPGRGGAGGARRAGAGAGPRRRRPGHQPPALPLALGAGACWSGYIVLSAHHARRLPGRPGPGPGDGGRHRSRRCWWRPSAPAPTCCRRGCCWWGRPSACSRPGFRARSTRSRCGGCARHTYALVLSVAPAVAAISGLAIRGQRLSVAQWLGIALVMVASAAAVAGAEPPDVIAAEPTQSRACAPAPRCRRRPPRS